MSESSTLNMPRYTGLRGPRLVGLVTTLGSLSFLLFGYDNGVMSGIITSNQFFAVVGDLSATTQGTVTSIFEVGATIGALFTMFLGDRFGRKKMAGVGAIILAIGAALQSSSYGIPQLIVARIITGLGIGALTATSPVYNAECSNPRDRGRNIAITLTSLIVGINLAYWIDYGFAYINSPTSWRVPLALQIVFCIAILVLLPFLPESPRWLFLVGREEEACASLSALRDLPLDDAKLQLEIEDIRTAIKFEDHGSSWAGMFTQDNGVQSRKRLFLACAVQVMQEMTGTNILTYYSTVIYINSVGLDRSLALLMGGFLQVWFLLASFVTWYTIDRGGRRKLFMFAFIGMGSCFLVLFGMLSLPTTNKAAGIVAIICIFLFQGFFTWGDMSTNWCYPSEILPLRLRTKGGALSTAFNWIITFMVVQVTPPGVASLGRFFYVLFACFNFVMAGIVFFYFPETAGLSLETIDSLFVDSNYTSWFGAVRASKKLHNEAKRSKGSKGSVGVISGKADGEVQHLEKSFKAEA